MGGAVGTPACLPLPACAGPALRHMFYPCRLPSPCPYTARRRVEQEYAPLYEKHGLGLTTWSPLASGILTGALAAIATSVGTAAKGVA